MSVSNADEGNSARTNSAALSVTVSAALLAVIGMRGS